LFRVRAPWRAPAGKKLHMKRPAIAMVGCDVDGDLEVV